MPSPSSDLSAWSAALSWEALPQVVRERVKVTLVDAVACAVAGRDRDETAAVRELAEQTTGPGSCTVLGSDRQLSPAGAALLNGYQITAVTLCDVLREAHCHVTPEVVAPALAVAEQRRASGAALLTAVAAGLEVTARIGLALDYPAFREAGWHAPGVIGPFGGAAAVGRLIGLDPGRQRNALGLAGSQAAGTFAQWGTPAIKFSQARGAMSGLLAGVLAEQGFDAAEEILTAEDGGLLTTYSNGGVPHAATDALGRRWELERIALRRWPAGSPLQTMITALLALLDEHPVDPDEVRQVRVRLPETVHGMHAEQPWDTPFRALLSAPYVVAVVLHDRRCWLDQFSQERCSDPLVGRFARERVRVDADPGLEGTASEIEVTMRDGSRVSAARAVPKGDPSDPLTPDEVVGKFRDACAGLWPEEEATRIAERLLALDEADDASAVLPMLRAAPAVRQAAG